MKKKSRIFYARKLQRVFTCFRPEALHRMKKKRAYYMREQSQRVFTGFRPKTFFIMKLDLVLPFNVKHIETVYYVTECIGRL